MKRVQLFEFEDLNWFPGFLRNYMTDFLQYLANATRLFRPATEVLAELIKETGQSEIVDLGSGGGGSLIWISEHLQEQFPGLKITMTDLYPNIAALEYACNRGKNLYFSKEPVDACKLPAEMKGIRTQFLSLHHFDPQDAVMILQNAVDSNAPIAIFEGQERSVASVLAMLFSPISVLLTTPMIRPFRLGRIIFTYLIPIVPIFVLWDGVVSSLRTYSVKEMQELISRVNNDGEYTWKTGRIKSGPGVNLYLTGIPRQSKVG